jgi:hypothetical protein
MHKRLKHAVESSIYAATFASLAGQIPPFTALPEETITIPLFAVLGFAYGLIEGEN